MTGNVAIDSYTLFVPQILSQCNTILGGDNTKGQSSRIANQQDLRRPLTLHFLVMITSDTLK